MPIDRYHYDEIYLGAPDDDEEFPDVTEEFAPDHPPEDFDADTRSFTQWTEADFAYDPLARKGWD